MVDFNPTKGEEMSKLRPSIFSCLSFVMCSLYPIM